jgi:hypothetical protein
MAQGDARWPHEMAVYLALGLLCGLRNEAIGAKKHVAIRMASLREDKFRGTDMILVYPGRAPLFIDTTRSRRRIGPKIRRSQRKARTGGRYVHIVSVPLEGLVMDVIDGPSLLVSFDRLVREEPVEFLSADFNDELAARLLKLGKEIVQVSFSHVPSWQSLFRIEGHWFWEASDGK